jgi:hypothetical protein
LMPPTVFRLFRTQCDWGAIAMTDIGNTATEAPDHHSDPATARLWVQLLAVIILIEIAALPVTRSLIAGLF